MEARRLCIGVWQPARGQQFLAKPVHGRAWFPIRVGRCVVPLSVQQGGAARAKAVEERLLAQVHAKQEEAPDIRSLVAIQICYFHIRPGAALLEEQSVPQDLKSAMAQTRLQYALAKETNTRAARKLHPTTRSQTKRSLSK